MPLNGRSKRLSPTLLSIIGLLSGVAAAESGIGEPDTAEPIEAVDQPKTRGYTIHPPSWPILPTGGGGYDSELGLGGELGLYYPFREVRGVFGRGWFGVEAVVEFYDQAHGLSAGYATKHLTIGGLYGYAFRTGYLRNEDAGRLAADERDYLS